ncbi:hypothetical protein T440DRAFT_554784 [Plenodomus tracheiphilus IPT5]|uniref:Wax synthase domain-containing protein n=1 Tax=Plenodomus tracheiphilus IPT5 TaxID=1408161 RepID=A0A6A7B665_9PLEO|nr:hypothetical protein T440DRAFT_554784 [Plenodomus tracheiphilus IPT5]
MVAPPYLPTSPLLVTYQIPFLSLLNIVALAIGPKFQIFRVAFSLPILIVLILQSLAREWDGGWGVHYAINCAALMIVFQYVDWVLLASPDTEGWHRLGAVDGPKRSTKARDDAVKDNGKMNCQAKRSGEATALVPQGFWRRFWWGMRLMFASTRYVRWSCQVKNVPMMEVHSTYPRMVFLARRTFRLAIFYLLKDALYSYTASSPHGSWQDIKHQKGVVGFSGYPWAYRMNFAWAHILLTYMSLEFAASAFSIVCVATGLSNPSDCPPGFGHVKHLFSLRKAWSVVWHQQCRRIASTPGIWLARDVMHLRKGSFASKYLQLFVAFGISAIVHAGGSMLTHGTFNGDASFALFMLQAVIIMIEDHVIDFGKKLGLKDARYWRVLGFVWTVFILGATIERWVGHCLEHGMWIHYREMDWFGIGPQM